MKIRLMILAVILVATSFLNVNAADAAEHSLTLVNEHWDTVTVQVREGHQNSCRDRNPVGERVLRKGQAWQNIPCGRPCWRKKLPGHGWGAWITTTCFSRSETHDIN